MTKGRNFDFFGASTLPDAFSDANSETLQVMASNLMQALQEAQDRLEEKGIRSTPALEVDGEIYAGEALSPERVKSLLNL